MIPKVQDHYANALRVCVCTAACLWDAFTSVETTVFVFLFFVVVVVVGFLFSFDQENTFNFHISRENKCVA